MDYNDIIGTVGVAMILLAYFGAAFNFINGKSSFYFFLNTVGAALACYASWLIGYWPFVILEGTWFMVSLIALTRTLKKSNEY